MSAGACRSVLVPTSLRFSETPSELGALGALDGVMSIVLVRGFAARFAPTTPALEGAAAPAWGVEVVAGFCASVCACVCMTVLWVEPDSRIAFATRVFATFALMVTVPVGLSVGAVLSGAVGPITGVVLVGGVGGG